MQVMNSLEEGLISRLRTDAIQRAKNRGNPEEEEIELAQEFSQIINNPLFPLSGSRRLLSGLSSQRPNN